MKRRIGMFVTVAFAVSACGGTDSSSGGGSPSDDVSSSDSVLVESGDGLASLLLPAGSLPDGMSADDVSLEVILNDSAEPGVPAIGVQLSPHGLVLSEPATLTLASQGALDAGFVALHQSGSVIEFLDGDVKQNEDGLVFSTPVEHFSLVFLYPDISLPSSIALAPKEVSPNQTQVAEITVEEIDSFSLWVDLPGDEPGTARLFTFALLPNATLSGSARWDFQSDRWDPEFHPEQPAASRANGWQGTVSSKCLIPNTTKVLYTASAVYDGLVRRGEAQPKDLIRFEKPAEAESPWVAPDDDDFIKLNQISDGDAITAALRAVSRSDSSCTVVTSTETTTFTTDTGTDSSTTSSTTSTTSTTEQPAEEIGSARDAVGINEIEVLVDAAGGIWWLIYLGTGWTYAQWELFCSMFVSAAITGWLTVPVGFAGVVGPDSTASCETHDGVVRSSGSRPTGDFAPRAYFRPDGAVLLESGLTIDDLPFGTEAINVTVESGVWESEAGDPPAFSKAVFDIPVSEFGSGDPLSDGSLTAACASP